MPELTADQKTACTSACTSTEPMGKETARALPVEQNFAEAMVLIARLPLTDAEKAEAVRRLLKLFDSGH